MQTYTVVSYIALGAIAFILYTYYTDAGKKALARLPNLKAQPVRKETPKPKKSKEKRAAPKAAPAAAPSESVRLTAKTTSFTTGKDGDDDGIDNKEFARRLTMVKTGTMVTGKKDDKKIKSLKQSQAPETVSHGKKKKQNKTQANNSAQESSDVTPANKEAFKSDIKSSAQTSTTQASLDDKSTAPATSMSAEEANIDDDSAGEPTHSDVTGVADMLEPAAPAAKTVRVVDVPQGDSKPHKPAKAPEPTMSKKQRQHKKKNELMKLQREEEERERLAKMEAQRRTARLAEGRPAKDGSMFTNQATNAWQQQKINGTASNASSVVPLDTFEAPKPVATQKNSQTGNAINSANGVSSSHDDQWETFRPEPEDEWSTVETKASKRKQRKGNEVPNGTSNAESNPINVDGNNNTKLGLSKPSFAEPQVNGQGDTPENAHQNKASAPARRPAPRVEEVEIEWDV